MVIPERSSIKRDSFAYNGTERNMLHIHIKMCVPEIQIKARYKQKQRERNTILIVLSVTLLPGSVPSFYASYMIQYFLRTNGVELGTDCWLTGEGNVCDDWCTAHCYGCSFHSNWMKGNQMLEHQQHFLPRSLGWAGAGIGMLSYIGAVCRIQDDSGMKEDDGCPQGRWVKSEFVSNNGTRWAKVRLRRITIC